MVFNNKNLYNKEDFDIILDTNNEIDIKRLVKKYDKSFISR